MRSAESDSRVVAFRGQKATRACLQTQGTVGFLRRQLPEDFDNEVHVLDGLLDGLAAVLGLQPGESLRVSSPNDWLCQKNSSA